MNTITLDARNVGSFLGPIASKYSYYVSEVPKEEL